MWNSADILLCSLFYEVRNDQETFGIKIDYVVAFLYILCVNLSTVYTLLHSVSATIKIEQFILKIYILLR